MNPARMSLKTFSPAIAALALVVVFAAGCDGEKDAVARADETAGVAQEAEHGHDHEEGVCDLDRAIAELMTDRCEHDMFTYQCDECRYETGMVKVEADLLDEDGPLQTARVARRATDESMGHNGEVRLNEERSAWLGPRASGTVRAILVDLGAKVRQGQILFTVDSPEFAEAKSAYLIARASLKLAEQGLERERDLYERKVCAKKDLLEAEAAREEAAATEQAAEEKLLAFGLNAGEIVDLANGGAQASAMPVKAPFDGTVLERNLGIGASVEPGQNLLLLGDTTKMWVWTSLYENEFAGVLQAQASGRIEAHVEVPAYPGRLFAGLVERVSGVVDETTRTAKVRVVVDNPDGLLRAGMFARVHLRHGGSEQALTVPAEAVLTDEGRAFVFVPAEPPYFVRRPVMIGRSWQDWVEIAHGLDEGDIVVSRGAFTLKSDVLRSKMGAGCAD